MKKQLVIFRFPGVTTNKLDQCWDELRRKGFDNPPGLIHHTAAQIGNNLVVVDVWESTEAFTKFGQTLDPILSKMGIPQVKPEIAPVYYEFVSEKMYANH